MGLKLGIFSPLFIPSVYSRL